MPESHAEAATHSAVDTVVEAIANWVNKYRAKFSATGLGQCTPDEVMQTAKDLGLPASDLRTLATKGPDSTERLRKMLVALHVDPDSLASQDPAVMRDLQRLCTFCSHSRRCDYELAHGTAAAHFHEFCPNAFTLDALFAQEKELPFNASR